MVCDASLFGSCSLVVLGNLTEFERGVLWLSENLTFDVDARINLFEVMLFGYLQCYAQDFENQISPAVCHYFFWLFSVTWNFCFPLPPLVHVLRPSAGPSGAANVPLHAGPPPISVEVSHSRHQTDMHENIFMPHFFGFKNHH